ncbi:penicillin-binding protein 1C [Neptunitalea sp. Y10]|uniref:peptidoglycan glycosyltransferase n=1 Tax=Neptunitalea lumnitzerae TaxID=2965509 RepID=A0ABQ5MFW9_9FLAO|nr:penicillin-binding protein 1C [Neptunitalea sp. Y10]
MPTTLFEDPTATVVKAANGQWLGAKIAADEQWRFPEIDTVPEKFKQCILLFEDEHFYKHPGVNPISMGKALGANIKAGKTVRGGSTITQQVIRLSRKGTARTYFEKLKESILATRLELRYSKNKILALYASHAPFGGNTVGLDIAAWRYFGIEAKQLSWAESATLAVLPNAPGIIYPGKNQSTLLKRRNGLLKKLKDHKIINQTTYELALIEPLPQKAYEIPRLAPHLSEYLHQTKTGKEVKTTINYKLQKEVNQIVKSHYLQLKQNHVYNIAALVLDVHNRNVLAYVGNSPTDMFHEKDVDMIHAPRSTGSILKPLLYAAMMDDGELLPKMLVEDIPTKIGDYSPQNFDETYNGAVPADEALARSLNIPAVRLLKQHGLEKFRDELDFFKLKDINRPAYHYGLPLILGGAESNLWDLCKTYASLASTVNHFNETSSEYYTHEFTEPCLLYGKQSNFGEKVQQKNIFDAGSIYATLEAMKTVNRPEDEVSWQYFESSTEIAWKTGTSFGNKDAWSIGLTKDYVVGIWVGNADGEGRPQITGVSSAAPILFDVFDVLPKTTWFKKPLDELIERSICTQSGYLASSICPSVTKWIPKTGARSSTCPYHHLVHVDLQKQFRVNASCQPIDKITTIPWFTLPPLMEYYYKKNHVNYKELPPYKTDCYNDLEKSMEFIYPENNTTITIAKDFDGSFNEIVLKIAHRDSDAKIFWYLDEQYIGQTKQFHELKISPSKGWHTITALDENGYQISRKININK